MGNFIRNFGSKIGWMKVMMVVIVIMIGSYSCYAATYYSKVAGDWSTASNWSTVSHVGAAASNFPVAGDIVYIQHAMTFSSNAACATISFNGTGTLTPITINSPYTLDVSGTIELITSTSPVNTTYTITGTGIVNCQNINCGTNLGTGTLSSTVTYL
jgi:hypothetical protein